MWSAPLVRISFFTQNNSFTANTFLITHKYFGNAALHADLSLKSCLWLVMRRTFALAFKSCCILSNRHFWGCMLRHTKRCFVIFVTAVCVLFLVSLLIFSSLLLALFVVCFGFLLCIFSLFTFVSSESLVKVRIS